MTSGLNNRTKAEVVSDIVFDILYSVNNFNRFLKFRLERFAFNKHSHLKQNAKLKGQFNGEKCFVLGNGPSLNMQEISKLKSENVFMVNRSFLDHRYKDIKPKYHIIVDNKLATGVWPISYLDDILEINPSVTFILNSKWFNDSKFLKYKNNNNIIWIDLCLELTRFNSKKNIDLTKRSYGKNVVENAIITAAYMGFDKVYFTGVDGDGFANLLLDVDSHSYGKNADDVDKMKSWVGVRETLNSVCRWMLVWYYLDKYTSTNGTEIINLTGRGIITMVKMDDFKSVIEKND